MRPKEWLYANGHIKVIGKGRLSKESIALVTEAAKTVFIEGYSNGNLTPAKPEKPKAASPNGEKAIAELPPCLYDPSMYVAVGFQNGKRVTASTKECCEHGTSVGWHHCVGGTVNAREGGQMVIHHYERIN